MHFVKRTGRFTEPYETQRHEKGKVRRFDHREGAVVSHKEILAVHLREDAVFVIKIGIIRFTGGARICYGVHVGIPS
jgi:hypothetical protein